MLHYVGLDFVESKMGLNLICQITGKVNHARDLSDFFVYRDLSMKLILACYLIFTTWVTNVTRVSATSPVTSQHPSVAVSRG